MNKNLFLPMAGLIVLAFLFSFVVNTPLLAQEKEEEVEDVMDMALEDLLNVEITTAGKKAEKVGEIPASVVIVTRAEIEKYGFQNVEEVLENIPGYYKIDEGFWYTTTSFGVRGNFPGQYTDTVIVLVNNIPQNEYFGYSSLLNLPVEAIDRIEVVRGPLSVIYGNGAFFGAINIVTNEIPKSGPTNSLSFAAGSNKAKRVNLRYSGESGDFKYVGNAGFDDTDGIDVPYADMMTNSFLLPFFGLSENATTGGKHGKDTRYFDLFVSYKDLTFSVNHTKVHKGYTVLLPAAGDEGSYGKLNVSRVDIGYKKEFSDKFTLEAKFDYNESKLHANYAILDENQYAPNIASANGYKLELDAFLTLSPKFEMTIGISKDTALDFHNSLDLPAFGFSNITTILAPGETVDTYAAFTQMDWKPTSKLKFTVGARIEKQSPYTLRNIFAGLVDATNPTLLIVAEQTYDNDELLFIPRAAVVYKFNEKNILKLMYGKAMKRPSPVRNTENYFLSGTLNPQKLIQAEIETFELNYILAPSPKFFASLSVFRNNMNDLFTLSYEQTAGGVSLIASNAGKLTTTGFELTLKTVPFENFHFEGSLMYQKTDDDQEEFKGIDVGYSPELLGYIRGYYDIPGGPTIGFTGRYVDKMLAGWDLGTASRLGADIDSYFIFGLNLRWNNIFDNWFINLNVANLFDEEIRYPTTSTNSGWTDLGLLGPGRTFLVTLGFKF